jgi:hypothetical protein
MYELAGGMAVESIKENGIWAPGYGCYCNDGWCRPSCCITIGC